MREGRRRKSVPGKEGEYEVLAEREKKRRYADARHVEKVATNAKAARGLIGRYQRELLLVGDIGDVPLPSGMPQDVDDALSLVKDSLTWVSKLAEAYTAPIQPSLLQSKGPLYLAAYVLKYADAKKIRGEGNAFERLASLVAPKPKVDGTQAAKAVPKKPPKPKPGGTQVAKAKRKKEPKEEWSASDLREKVQSFKKEHQRLYKSLIKQLDELHLFHSTR